MQKKGILVDRDGVLIENRPDYVKSISEAKIILGVPGAIQQLWQAGYTICIVTNQAGIAKGLYPYSAVIEIHEYIEKACGADIKNKRLHWYICPHKDEDKCMCRKPKPGLLLKALEEHHLESFSTWMVGDNRHDITAGRASYCQTCLVQTGLGKSQGFTAEEKPDCIMPDLPAFVAYLLEKNPDNF